MYSIFLIAIVNIVFWVALHIFGAAFITTFIPNKFYDPMSFLFKERAFEKELYKVIKVGKWKDKLPIYQKRGCLDRKNFTENLSKEYLKQFTISTCKAELVHLSIGIFGFSSILFVVLRIEPLYMFFIISIVMFFIQLPFILVQRYNRPRLLKLLYRIK